MAPGIRKSFIVSVLLLVGAVMAPVAHALKVGQSLMSMAAGGNTIGGPGIFRKAVGNTVTIGEYAGPGGAVASKNLCVTLTTVRGRISIDLADSTGGPIGTNAFIFPGTSGSKCGESVSTADLTCHPGGGNCVGVWRIDEQ